MNIRFKDQQLYTMYYYLRLGVFGKISAMPDLYVLQHFLICKTDKCVHIKKCMNGLCVVI